MDMNQTLSINQALFENAYETALFDAFSAVNAKNYESFEAHLDALFALKPHIDAFFDNVMVNAENLELRANRQNLIASIYTAFKSIADIKEITL